MGARWRKLIPFRQRSRANPEILNELTVKSSKNIVRTLILRPLPLLATATILVAALLPMHGADNRQTPTVVAVQSVMPSVVNIATETIVEVRDPFTEMRRLFYGDYYSRQPRQTTKSLGSGVIIDEEGYLLTNEHVVKRADKIWVKVGGTEYPATRIAGDAAIDVALVKINAPEGTRFSAVTMAGDDDLRLGETVLALGNPFGLGGSVSRGILSSKSRRQPLEDQPLDIRDWLQTDAAINPGNSGGPLINLNGELIGLNVAVYGEGEGIGFAIPIRRVREGISRFLSPEKTSSLWFGARINPNRDGMKVSDVEPNSPAAVAGLKVGDRIESLNGRKPRSFIDFTSKLLSVGVKEPVKLTIVRGGATRTVSVKLVREQDFFDNDLLERSLGIRVMPNSPDMARRLNLPPYPGFVITDIKKNGPADQAGLEPEYVIRGVDEKLPWNLIELAKYVFGKKPGDQIQVDVVFKDVQGRYRFFRQGRTAVKVD